MCERICSQRSLAQSETQQPISVTEPGAVPQEAGEAGRGKITTGLVGGGSDSGPHLKSGEPLKVLNPGNAMI